MAFLLTKEIFERDYERIHTSTILLGSETRKPFIKCFYYDNPASLVLPSNFCGGGGQGTGGTINPVFICITIIHIRMISHLNMKKL